MCVFACRYVCVALRVNIGEREEKKKGIEREMAQHYWKGRGISTGSDVLRVCT